MIKIDRLTVKYHNKVVGTLSLTPDNKRFQIMLLFQRKVIDKQIPPLKP